MRFDSILGDAVATVPLFDELVVHRLRPLPDAVARGTASQATSCDLSAETGMLAAVGPDGVRVTDLAPRPGPEESAVDWSLQLPGTRSWQARLRIAPLGLVVGPAIRFQPGAGQPMLEFPVPADVSLVDMPLVLQAVMLDDSQPCLSNGLTTRVGG